MNTRATLSAAQIAAIEKGTPVAEVAAIPGSDVTDPALVQAAADALKAEQTAAQGKETPAAPAADANIVGFLQEQLAARDKTLLEVSVTNRDLQAKVTAMESSHGPLLEIARGALAKMQVALGGTAPDLSALDATALLAQHASVSATFTSKFPVDGVAVPAKDDADSRKQATNVTHIDTARVKAVRFGK